MPLVAGALALAVIHPTYAIFVCVPLAGFALARLLLAPGDREGLGRLGVALGAIAVPSGLFFAWLLPVVRDTGSYRPGAEERAAESPTTRPSSMSSATAFGSLPRRSRAQGLS